jgi:hypothetical protein
MFRTALSLSLFALAALGTATPASALFVRPGGGLVIECPPLAKVFCGSSLDPSVTGEATATSDCPGSITITYQDSVQLPGSTCPGARFGYVIVRTWTATDECGNTASCTQAIDVVRQLWKLDIHPTSCPNPVQVGSGSKTAIVPVALLGTAFQNVADIDPASISIWREDCQGGPVYPLDFKYSDVSAPWAGGERCGCTTDGPDGFTDLLMRFNRYDFVHALGLNTFPQGSYVRLVINARTFSGCELVGSDCVRIQ